MKALDWLQSILQSRLGTRQWQWLEQACAEIKNNKRPRDLFLSFSLAVRKCGKDELTLSVEELELAEQACPGWHPIRWRSDHAARAVVLLHADSSDPDMYLNTLDRLFQAADLGESEALYLSLPLLPHPKVHLARAQEGLRSNVKAVFEAVAHHSPLPRDQFADDAWNQMVLKALFIDSALDPICGLEQRCNPGLTRMLCDYAHERWAASRSISIELWRCVGACADDAALADIKRVLDSGSHTEQLAAALSIRERHPEILVDYPGIHEQLTQGLCWHELLANL